jgi:hypothetical protein
VQGQAQGKAKFPARETREEVSVTILDIRMAGIDYQLAGVAIREIFSFTKASLAEALEQIKKEYPDLGCVILSTCNRTEIYLSCQPGVNPEPGAVLCAAGLEPKRLAFVKNRAGDRPWLFLLQARKGGKPGLEVLPDVLISEGSAQYGTSQTGNVSHS